MGERLLRGHVRELVAGAAAERPAGCGQNEARDACAVAPLEALVERRVLAVHGQEQPSPTLVRGDGELAGRDEALLVGERERHTVLERPQRRPDAGESDDGVQDDVGAAALQQSNGIPADLGVLDGMLGGELPEWRRAGLERAQLELRMLGDDFDRLPADRPRRPEDRDTFHAARMPEPP